MRLVVVGGGTAGIAAALQARELGADVALLEADEVGGTTLNRGPAPVRTLARAARLAGEWSSWDRFGLRGPAPTPDLPAILARSAEVAHYARDAMHLADHLRGYGVELAEHTGPVTFTGPSALRARDGRSWTGDRVILAVGGYAAPLPVPGAELALTYNDIPSLTSLPADAAVIGGADTGCQIASILADFGVRVTVFEAAASLIASADPAVSAGLTQAYAARGITVRTGTRVSALEPARDGARVTVLYATAGDGHATEGAAFGAVFAAIGWPANTATLGLGAAGVQDGWSAIPVDASLRTNVPHIFAAGDVNGHAKLVQVARAEGRIAARNAISGPHNQASYRVVPSGSFTDPEYGQVGLTEPVAAHGHDIVTGTADYRDLLRPVADGRPDGFCKLIADRRDHTILGGHVLGEYSAEIIQVIATAMTANLTVEQVATIPFAFPTVTEAVGMAAQMICRELGVGQFPQVWSTLAPAARLPGTRDEVQAQVERWARVRQRADREVVHPGGRHLARGRQPQPAARLEPHPGIAPGLRHREPQVSEGHVVEQQEPRARGQRAGHLGQRVALHLERHPRRRRTHRRDRRGHPARRGDVVVLDQGCVAQSHPVVLAAAAPHGVLLEQPQPGRGLAGVPDHRPGSRHRVRPGPGRGRDAGQVAEEVEHGPLRAEHRHGRAADPQHRVPRLDPRPVRLADDTRRTATRRIGDRFEHGECHRHPRHHPPLPRHHVGRQRRVRRGGPARHVWPVPEILRKRPPHRLPRVVRIEPRRP